MEQIFILTFNPLQVMVFLRESIGIVKSNSEGFQLNWLKNLMVLQVFGGVVTQVYLKFNISRF